MTNQLVGLDPGRNFQAGRQMGQQNRLLREQRRDLQDQRQQAMQRRNLAGAAMFAGLMENAPGGQEQQFFNIGKQILGEQGVDVSDFPEEFNGEVAQTLTAARSLASQMGLIKANPSQKFSKNLQTAVDAQGNLVFVQGSELGGARPLEGFRPVDPAQQAAEKQTAIDTQSPSGQARTQKLALEAEQKDKEAKAANAAKIQDAQVGLDAANRLLQDDAFEGIFGRGDALIPDFAKSQTSLDAIADLEQLTGLLSLENRQKLKGQGTITDQEAATLERASTILSNRRISNDAARRELNRVKQVFVDAAARAGGQLSEASAPQQQESTFTLPNGIQVKRVR